MIAGSAGSGRRARAATVWFCLSTKRKYDAAVSGSTSSLKRIKCTALRCEKPDL